MATLRIRIVDSKFVSHNGVNLETFEEHYISGNGWKAAFSKDGKLECIAIQYYGGVLHLVKLKVHKDGYVKSFLKIGDEPAKILKKYKLESWPAEVVLGLPGGYIDNRRPYIRKKKFQDFLDIHEISSVRNENPNGTYLLTQEINNKEVVHNVTIQSDGNVKPVNEDDKYGIYIYDVTDASWVITSSEQNGKRERVLYTTGDPYLIENLPKI